jgi:hypothetical protein
MAQKLKVMTIIGTRPEIIRLSEVIKRCDKEFDHVLVHTGQNYAYELNQIFFEELGLRKPDYYLNAVGKDLGETMGNVISKSYDLIGQVKPDAILDFGRYQFGLIRDFRETLEDSDFPYGSRQPLLGLERRRNDQPHDC